MMLDEIRSTVLAPGSWFYPIGFVVMLGHGWLMYKGRFEAAFGRDHRLLRIERMIYLSWLGVCSALFVGLGLYVLGFDVSAAKRWFDDATILFTILVFAVWSAKLVVWAFIRRKLDSSP